MSRNLNLPGLPLALGLIALAVALANLAGPTSAGTLPAIPKSFTNLLHNEKSAKELKMSFKVFLTNMKVRQVPLAKARSERLLAKLYREERLLEGQIADLNRNLGSYNDKQRRQSMRVLEVDKNPSANSERTASGSRRSLVKVHELSQSRVDQWNTELKDKMSELEHLRAKIDEAKNIIKHPDSYIAIPSNYGRADPEEVQDREREVLIRDREIMDYRQRIEMGAEEPPAFMTDHW